MREKQRMLSGKLYIAKDEELAKENKKGKIITRLFNNSLEEEQEYRKELLKDLFAETGENIYIEPPFRCDYGCNIYIGENFYANFDCIILDVCNVRIGDNVLFGPRVNIFAASHPIDASVRNSGLEYGKEVKIGNSVWVGGNTVINPGITIGDNVIIGSGSVVTKDVQSNVIVAGNPARVIRKITDKDKEFWEKEQEKYSSQK